MSPATLRAATERIMTVAWRPSVASTTIFIVLSLFSVITWYRFEQSIDARAQEKFAREAQDLEEPVLSRLNLYAEVLRAGKGFFLGSQRVERHEWTAFVHDLDVDDSVRGLIGVGFAELLKTSTSTAPGTILRSRVDPSISIQTVAGRTSYLPVIYLEPQSGSNEKFIGFDVLSATDTAAELESANGSLDVMITGSLDITAGTAKPVPGLVMFAPLRSAPTSSSAESVGFVFGMFPFESLLSGLAIDQAESDIDIHVYEGGKENRDDEHLVYELHSDASKQAERAGFKPKFVLLDTVNVYGRTWTFEFHSLPSYEAALGRATATTILVEGFIISTFAAYLLYFVMSRRQVAESMAKVMTLDLNASKAELEKRALEAERLNKLMVARELKIVELKKRAGEWHEPEITRPTATRVLRAPVLFSVKKIPAKLQSRRVVATGTTEVVFHLSQPMSYHAGQYVTVVLPGLSSSEGVHDFSIVSSPRDPDNIAIVFRDSDSPFKRWLRQAQEGADVVIEGPKGTLLMPADVQQSIVCLGGGVGISPFVSMAMTATGVQALRSMTLVSFNASADREPYGDTLRALGREHPSFRYVPVYGDVTSEVLMQFADRITSSIWYIAGPPGMVEAAKKLVKELGVPTQHVREEHFTGYGV